MSLGSALCTQCGLCCTGALHNYAVLEPEEIEFARDLGLMVRGEGRPGFALPCPKLQNSVCSIYGNRPKVCSRYKCQLLENVELGSISFEEAIEKVSEAKALIRNVETLMPDHMTLPQARAMTLGSPFVTTDPPVEAAILQLKLAVAALCLYLDKHFKHSRERKLLSLEPTSGTRVDMEMT